MSSNKREKSTNRQKKIERINDLISKLNSCTGRAIKSFNSFFRFKFILFETYELTSFESNLTKFSILKVI